MATIKLKKSTSPDDQADDAVADLILSELIATYPEDMGRIIEFLEHAAKSPELLDSLMRYKHQPVGIREFITSKQFLNKKADVWPAVLDELEIINSGQYLELVATGGIGVAKTTIAVYTQAYQLYLLSCLRDVHKVLDIDPSHEIVIIFQSITEAKAEEVGYARFRDMVEKAPYFQTHFPFDTSLKSKMEFPGRIIVKPVAGTDTAAIGENVVGGVIDEVNYMEVIKDSKRSRNGDDYDQAVKNYNAIAKRRQSRFMNFGWMPGMLCLVSSRNYPGQFTDVKEKEAKTNKRIYIYDKRLWQLRPERFSFFYGKLMGEMAEKYSADTALWFRVFLGDVTRKPRVLAPDEVIVGDDNALVMQIPVEYKETFTTTDLLAAIRDIAGQSTQAMHPFILDVTAVGECFGKTLSILSRTDCDFVNTKIELYPKRIVNPAEPRFAHFDLAVSHDSAGVAIGHIPGFKHMNRGDYVETLPMVQFDMTLEVRPPLGGEIIFEKIRQIIYDIRKMGLFIKWVSFDNFQSKDSMQIMSQHGFMTDYQSMDADTYAYDVTKQAFYDRRLILPAHTKAQEEFVRLEYDAKTRKIDHPPLGSKDVSDAIAGVVYGLTMRRELWVRHGIPLHRVPASIMAKTKNETEKPKGKYAL